MRGTTSTGRNHCLLFGPISQTGLTTHSSARAKDRCSREITNYFMAECWASISARRYRKKMMKEERFRCGKANNKATEYSDFIIS